MIGALVFVGMQAGVFPMPDAVPPPAVTAPQVEVAPVVAAPAAGAAAPIAEQLGCVRQTIGADLFDRTARSRSQTTMISREAFEAAVLQCQQIHGWDDEVTQRMGMHAVTLMIEKTWRHESGFSAARMARIDAAYEATDRAAMRAAVGGFVEEAIAANGRPRNMTREESRFFGGIATRAGISNDNSDGARVDPIVVFRLIRETIEESLGLVRE
jgi:hypothetical protein